MRYFVVGSLIGLVGLSPALAQNGDRKGHDKMGKIVPEDLIPPAPVLSVDEALKTFTIEKGFVIEPVAAEPLVDKPVALTFDPSGRMWVCEMRGYMPDIDGKLENRATGRIAILEDTNGDGKVDKRTTFLDKIVLPRAISLVPGGILYGDQDNLYFVARDGDKPKGKAVVVDDKFAPGGNVEHKTNGLMTGIDNWLYNAKSNARFKFIPGENKIIKDSTAFRGQWGISRDNFGRLFHNSNSTLLIGDRVLPNLLNGNNSAKMKSKTTERIGSNAVFPGRVTPGLNRAYISSHNGYSSNTIDPKTFKLTNATGACGPVIYRGNNLPASVNGNGFVCESSAQLIKMIGIENENGTLKGSHPLEKRDFLTSTDERFRPVNMYNAPDGSLYILDMYHGIIQHKTYMTTYLRGQTLSRGLEGPGYGHGRIYRIRSSNKPLAKVENLAKASDIELIKKLDSPIGAVRDLAQKELIDRNADPKPIVAALETGAASDLTNIHLLWTLEGLGALRAEHLAGTLTSKNEELISSALYAALSLTDSELIKLQSSVAAVRATAMTAPYIARILAATPSPVAQETLVAFLKQHHKTSLVREAAISGLGGTAILFDKVNRGRFSEKSFDKWLQESKSGPQKQIDPKTLLKGEHLASFIRGEKLYSTTAACIGCHGQDGAGLANLGPQLDGSDWVIGSEIRLVKILIHGLTGPIQINRKTFTPQAFMPGLGVNPTITDGDIADVSTFIRANWTNRAPKITEATVTKIRKETSGRSAGHMYSQKDFPVNK
ncbi:MAG: c-type cytochrome [Akkermansiaceae bacterium]|nr:c-type cytochrome [Akkermansiaceae bacterium]